MTVAAAAVAASGPQISELGQAGDIGVAQPKPGSDLAPADGRVDVPLGDPLVNHPGGNAKQGRDTAIRAETVFAL